MSLGDGFEIQEVFESAVTIVRNLPKEGPIKPSDELKLKLYAYFKQATHGPNDTSKPRFYQIVESYKWDAWRKLGEMPREEAMLNYIGELKQVMDTIPREETNDDDSKHFEDVLGKRFYDYCKSIVSFYRIQNFLRLVRVDDKSSNENMTNIKQQTLILILSRVQTMATNRSANGESIITSQVF